MKKEEQTGRISLADMAVTECFPHGLNSTEEFEAACIAYLAEHKAPSGEYARLRELLMKDMKGIKFCARKCKQQKHLDLSDRQIRETLDRETVAMLMECGALGNEERDMRSIALAH